MARAVDGQLDGKLPDCCDITMRVAWERPRVERLRFVVNVADAGGTS